MANTLFLSAGGDETGGLELFSSTTGTVSADNTAGDVGPYAVKCDSAAGAAAIVARNSFLTQAGRIYFRFKIDTVPTGASTPILSINNSSGGNIFRVRIKTDGTIQGLVNGGATTDGTQVISTDTWYRCTIVWSITSASDYDMKIFIDGTLQCSFTEAGGNLTNSTADRAQWGWITSPGATRNIWVRDIAVDDDAGLTDLGDLRCTNKTPGTNNSNAFDTTLGTGAVNERPISETNGKQHAGTGTAEQTYQISSASSGDEDISGKTLFAIQGWIRARKGSGGGSPVDTLSLDGSDYSVTLTTSAVTYLKPLTQATYPTAPKGIGMNRTTGAAPDCFLYDCGVTIAYFNSGGGSTPFSITINASTEISLSKSVSKILNISSTTAISLTKSISKLFNIDQPSVISLTKAIARSFLIDITHAISYSRGTAASFVINSSTAVSLSKSISKLLNIDQPTSISFTKSISKLFNIDQPTAVSLTKAIAKSFVINISHALSYARATIANFVINATTSISFTKSISKLLNIDQPTSLSFTKAIAKLFNIDQPTSLSFGNTIPLAFVIAATTSVSLTKAIAKSFVIAVTTVVSSAFQSTVVVTAVILPSIYRRMLGAVTQLRFQGSPVKRDFKN